MRETLLLGDTVNVDMMSLEVILIRPLRSAASQCEIISRDRTLSESLQ